MMKALNRKRRLIWLIGALGIVAAGVACYGLLPAAALPLPPPGETLTEAAKGLDEIVIEAAFDPDERSVTVWQRMTLTSRVDNSRDALVVRAMPNAYQSVDASPVATEEYYDQCYPEGFSAGGLQMAAAAVQMPGQPETDVAYRYTDDAKTVLLLPLPALWQTGESLTVTLRYTLTLPKAAARYGVWNGVYVLGNAFALPAVWENGAYRTDAYGPVGDPFISDAANFTLTLTTPRDYRCAATVYPSAVESRDGSLVYRFYAPAARDFALTLSRDYQSAQAMAGNTLVSAYAADASRAKEMLRYAQYALGIYGELYGAYPYQSFTVAEVSFPFGGMEYPGMTLIAANMKSGRELEQVIAHETAHQWWYAVVGSDAVNQAWQDEALCEFSALNYAEARYGQGERDSLYETQVAPSLRVTLPKDETPGAPLSYFSSMSDYGILVYQRGNAMLCAVDQATGGGLNGFLKAYYQRYAFQRATREDFTAMLNDYTGEDMTPLMTDYLDTVIEP